MSVGRYGKAFAAILGSLTAPVLIGIAHLAGWDLDLDTAVWLVGILSPLGAGLATWRALANTPADEIAEKGVRPATTSAPDRKSARCT
jgi:hypothetical protein